jgi:hypothetical protein
MVSFGDLGSWSSDGLSRASTNLRADLKVLEKAKDDVDEQAVPGSWLGLSRIIAEARKNALVSAMDEHIEAVRTFEFEIFVQADAVKEIETEVDAIVADARREEFDISYDGTVTDVKKPPVFHHRIEAEEYGEGRRNQGQALADRVAKVVQAGYDVDSALVAARPVDTLGQDQPNDVVDPQVARDWDTMSDEERRKVLEHIADQIAAGYGVDDFEVRFEDLEDADGDGKDDDPTTDSHGSWSEDDHVLRIDLNDVDDPGIIGTIAHEVRHSAQNKYVDDYPDLPPGIDPDEVEDWKENFDDYKTSEDDGFDAYWNQPVEEDAREAGDGYLRDYDGDDLDDDREAVR